MVRFVGAAVVVLILPFIRFRAKIVNCLMMIMYIVYFVDGTLYT